MSEPESVTPPTTTTTTTTTNTTTTNTVDDAVGDAGTDTISGISSVVVDPLNVGDKCQVRWRNGELTLDAVVVERRPVGYRKRRKLRNTDNKNNNNNNNNNNNKSHHEETTTAAAATMTEVWNLPAREIEYYVHYENHDRRLDEWVTLDEFVLETLERTVVVVAPPSCCSVNSEPTNAAAPMMMDHALTISRSTSGDLGDSTDGGGDNTMENANNNNNNDPPGTVGETTITTTTPLSLTVGGNWHGNSGDPALAAFEREHEQTTKLKNIEMIVMGEWEVEAWYYSPFPDDYCDLERLYVCEFCLTYCRKVKTYKQHLQTCHCREPPGRRIYSQPNNHGEHLAVYELDGQDHKAYCQKLCLLAKLFLDHKTLYYDVNPFYFYVVTKVDSAGAAHIVGYFSKEKVSSEGYNLACILTFPQYQKAGYGKFIISLSYELTKREGKTGSPEKPLSDLGKLSYRSYWKHVLLHLLARHDTTQDQTPDISIPEMSAMTGIKTEDILSTLQSLDMIKVWKGQHVVYVEQSFLQQYMEQQKQFRLCDPDFLDWKAPPPSPEPGNQTEE